jgi:hypothetical protein
LESKRFYCARIPRARREVLAERLVHADLCKKPSKARIGTKRIGHGFGTEINEAVVALRVGTIKPVESRVVFTEPGVNCGEVKRGNVAGLREVIEISDSSARACGVTRKSKGMTVQRDHDGMVGGEFAPL